MRRFGAAGAVLLVVLAGCEASEPQTPASPSGGGQTTTPSPQRLPEIVLLGIQDEAPATWDLLTTVPFGDSIDELGYRPEAPETLPTFPCSFAIGPDGSLWILDSLKQRIAHYSSGGEFLAQVGHVPQGEDRLLRDLVWSGDALYVSEHDGWTAEAWVTRVTPEGAQSPPVLMTYQGEAGVLTFLAAGASDLTGWFGGYAEVGGHELSTGPHGWASLEVPESGAMGLLPGIPVDEGTWVLLEGYRNDALALDFTFATIEAAAIQPIRIQLVASPGGASIAGGAGADGSTAVPDGIATYVMVSSALPVAGGENIGGRWFLQVKGDGSPLVWQRLPDPGLSDETQVRHLSVGLGGDVYLMLPQPDGMEFLRLPQE
jgi:hypothetical protein